MVLHSTSVTFDGLNQFLTAIQEGHRADAATIVPPGKAAATDLGGPLVSLVLLIVAVPLTGRRPRAWPVAMGASFAWRFVAPALVTGVLLLRAMAHNRTPLAANVDEYNAALETWYSASAFFCRRRPYLCWQALAHFIGAFTKGRGRYFSGPASDRAGHQCRALRKCAGPHHVST